MHLSFLTCDKSLLLVGCNWNFGDLTWRYFYCYFMVVLVSVPTATLIYLFVEKPAMDARKIFKNEYAGSSFESLKPVDP